MEDYEKKYKEALGRAKKWASQPTVWSSDDICQKIFPELRESEDERIKTNIIKLLRFVRDTHHQYSDECNEAIDWLKKQSNKETVEHVFPELKESEDERIRKELIRAFTVTADKRDCEIYGNGITYRQVLDWLEKQSEQKHAEFVTVVERDGEQWVRVCACGENFIIAAHDYKDGDKTRFDWKEACNIGTFSEKTRLHHARPQGRNQCQT